jgi:hypothetical protein
MAFHSKVKFSKAQLESDAEEMPAFVRAVDARLRQEYPEYTIGTWVHFKAQREVKWSVVAVSGGGGGFRVIFRLPTKDPTAARLKVVQYSKIFGFLGGLSLVIAFLVALGVTLSGGGNFIVTFLVTMVGLVLISWFLSGTIVRMMGKAIPEEELQKIGRLVLEALS